MVDSKCQLIFHTAILNFARATCTECFAERQQSLQFSSYISQYFVYTFTRKMTTTTTTMTTTTMMMVAAAVAVVAAAAKLTKTANRKKFNVIGVNRRERLLSAIETWNGNWAYCCFCFTLTHTHAHTHSCIRTHAANCDLFFLHFTSLRSW